MTFESLFPDDEMNFFNIQDSSDSFDVAITDEFDGSISQSITASSPRSSTPTDALDIYANWQEVDVALPSTGVNHHVGMAQQVLMIYNPVGNPMMDNEFIYPSQQPMLFYSLQSVVGNLYAGFCTPPLGQTPMCGHYWPQVNLGIAKPTTPEQSAFADLGSHIRGIPDMPTTSMIKKRKEPRKHSLTKNMIEKKKDSKQQESPLQEYISSKLLIKVTPQYLQDNLNEIRISFYTCKKPQGDSPLSTLSHVGEGVIRCDSSKYKFVNGCYQFLITEKTSKALIRGKENKGRLVVVRIGSTHCLWYSKTTHKGKKLSNIIEFKENSGPTLHVEERLPDSPYGETITLECNPTRQA